MPLRLPSMLAASVMLCSCGGDTEMQIRSFPATSGEAGSAITLDIGGETIEGFNWIRCPGAGAYAMADGKYQDRLLRVAMGASPGSTRGVQINIDARQEVWEFNEGKISFDKDDRTYTAAGTLKGRAGMAEPTADEVGKVVPFKGDDIRSFRITIQCP